MVNWIAIGSNQRYFEKKIGKAFDIANWLMFLREEDEDYYYFEIPMKCESNADLDFIKKDFGKHFNCKSEFRNGNVCVIINKKEYVLYRLNNGK